MSPVAYPGIFPLLTLSSTLYLYFSPNITALIALLAVSFTLSSSLLPIRSGS